MLKSIVLKILAGLALLSGVYFLTVVGVLHLVRSDLNPISEPISFYRQNESSWYLTSGFLLVGAGEIVLAYLLPIVLPTVKLPGRFLLVLSGVGVMMLGIQREGTVHLLGALLQAILFPVALLLLADALADSFERRFSRFVSLTNMALFPLLMLAFAHSPLLYPTYSGISAKIGCRANDDVVKLCAVENLSKAGRARI